jgi:hypothetical protein
MASRKMRLCNRQFLPADLQQSNETYFINNMTHVVYVFLIVMYHREPFINNYEKHMELIRLGIILQNLFI